MTKPVPNVEYGIVRRPIGRLGHQLRPELGVVHVGGGAVGSGVGGEGSLHRIAGGMRNV